MEVKGLFRAPSFHFAWRSHRNVNLILPLCLLIAVFLHVAAIFTFDIIYGKGGSAIPRPAEVVVIFPDSKEYKKIAEWLEGNDPSLLYTEYDPDGMANKALRVDYRPTFDLAATPLLAPPPQRSEKASSEVFLPRDIIASLSPDSETQPVAIHGTALPTYVEWQGDVQPDGPQPPPPGSNQSADDTTFLVGVLPEGRIGYILPEKKSGSNPLDQEAERYLQGLQMKESSSNKVRWGSVTFHWGMPPKGGNP